MWFTARKRRTIPGRRSTPVPFGRHPRARVTGVILTGTLDDAVARLAEIKRRGGVAVVQEPATALFSGMPDNALKYADADHVAPLHDIEACGQVGGDRA